MATFSPSGSAGAIVEISNSAVSPANQFTVIAITVQPGERPLYAFPDGCTNIGWKVRQLNTEVRFYSDVAATGYYTTSSYFSGSVNTKGVTFGWESDTACVVELSFWGPKGSLEYEAVKKAASELFTLTEYDVSQKRITLTLKPDLSYNISVTPREGCTQFYGSDFTVAGKDITWNSLGLDGLLDAGDILQVDYFY
jgi:hypothetical protein